MLLLFYSNNDECFDWNILRYILFDCPDPDLLRSSTPFEERYALVRKFCSTIELNFDKSFSNKPYYRDDNAH